MDAGRPASVSSQADAVSFEHVLRAELDEIAASRKMHGVDAAIHNAAEGSAAENASASELAGLAFSGGGIRSATFNLGVLQALAELGLLHRFDYLSTVSGGGYIGFWLHGCARSLPASDKDMFAVSGNASEWKRFLSYTS